MKFSPYRILRYSEKLQRILKGKVCDPVMVEFFLTQRCNHKCPPCLFKEYHRDIDLKYGYLSRVLNEISGRVRSIEYCGGGEPTLHPNFYNIIRTAYDQNLQQGLMTNGSTLQKYYIYLLAFKYVRISLDASNEHLHRKVHGSNDFISIVNGIKTFIKAKKQTKSEVEIGLKFLVSKHNVHDIEDFVEFAHLLEVDNVQIKIARNCKYEIGRIKEDVLENITEKYPGFVIDSTKKSYLATPWCYANLLSTFIDSDGSVMICCYYHGREEEHKIGNIYESGFWDIWYGDDHMDKVNNIDVTKCNTYDCRFHKYNQVLKELEEVKSHFV